MAAISRSPGPKSVLKLLAHRLSLHKNPSETCLYQSRCRQTVPGEAAKKSHGNVSWFTDRLGWLGLNVRNDPENLPAIVRSERRHRHRLRPDRSRNRRNLDCADLSRSDLIDLTEQHAAGLAATGYPSSAIAPHRGDFPIRTVGIGHKARCRAFSPPARGALSLPNPRIPITTKSEA
jgi:hypothetical protein